MKKLLLILSFLLYLVSSSSAFEVITGGDGTTIRDGTDSTIKANVVDYEGQPSMILPFKRMFR